MDFKDPNDNNENPPKAPESPSSEDERPAEKTDEQKEKESETAATAESKDGLDQKEKGHREPKKHDKDDHEEVKSLKGKLKKKEHELKHQKKENEELKKELSELKDKYLRALAEMDNQRKRLDREKNDFYQFALGDILKDVLSVLDNFERALQSKDQTDGKSYEEGIELIHKLLLDLIRKRGVTLVEAEGIKFDPTIHQAILTEESEEVKEPEIGEVLQKGYKINARLLRPALVKVIVPKKS
jgi:molecular chaperone GrpE